MFRILKCVKDSYITNKIIAGNRVTDANTGQAGTLDLYKLYDETYLSGSTNPVETSRVLLKFDLDPLREVTGSINLNSSSFKCFLKLNDIYGGQPVPSNYSLFLAPLARDFDEGRGADVIAYRDLDSCNWITASISQGTVDAWAVSGAYASGALGDSGIDYYVSGVLNVTSVSLGVTQSFARGDENLGEDLEMDITSLVSGTLAGIIPDKGFRLSFIKAQEDNVYTYFVKRFSSRHTRSPLEHPRIEVKAEDSISDLALASYLDLSTPIYVYNNIFGTYRNFTSGSSEVTGSNSLLLTLVTSSSILVNTTSWSETHSASITYTTSSWIYYSASFSGSQYSIGNNSKTGIYYSNVFLSSSDLNAFLGKTNSVDFLPLWQSVDKTYTYYSGSFINFKRKLASGRNVAERNFVINITNLKHYYTQEEKARFRVFVQDYNTELQHNKLPIDLVSEVYERVYWRLLHSFTRDVLVPFDLTYNSTKLSSDAGGMYFDVYMKDLDVNQVYEIEFAIIENDQQYLILDQGFRFKVIK
jgi:hypothetical protein